MSSSSVERAKKPLATTKKQKQALKTIENNEVIFIEGLAGTSKTHLSVRYAAWALLEGHFKKIIITRPAVACEEEIGFLPGPLEEKLSPYLQPIYEQLGAYFPKQILNKLMQDEIIKIVPFSFMRGCNFHDSVVILDETQNCTFISLNRRRM